MAQSRKPTEPKRAPLRIPAFERIEAAIEAAIPTGRMRPESVAKAARVRAKLDAFNGGPTPKPPRKRVPALAEAMQDALDILEGKKKPPPLF